MKGSTTVLKAKARDRIGTRYAQRVRGAGGLPAVIYGHKQDVLPVSLLDAKEALSHLHKGERVFEIQLESGPKETVLLKDVQFDYLGTNVVHCDFARVDLAERVKVKVPVHLVGEAKGLKSAGAILLHPVNEIEIECAVRDIPDHVEVDIAELDVGHAIEASSAKLPDASMKLITDPHAKLAQIVIQQEIVEPTAEAGAVDAAAAQPEVLTAKKPAEGEEAAAAGAKPGEKKDAKPAAGAAKPAAGGEKKK